MVAEIESNTISPFLPFHSTKSAGWKVKSRFHFLKHKGTSVDLFCVAMGGAIGAVLRYIVGGVVFTESAVTKFPYSTFTVNVVGCVLIGFLGALIVKHDMLSQELRLFLITGILGGFTTFSAFGLDAFYLIRDGDYAVAVAYVLGSVAFGLLGLFVAFQAVPHSAT